MELKGKTAFITGASSGIGLACAHALAEAGANVALSARRGDEVRRIADGIAKRFRVEAFGFELDVRSRAAVESAIASLPSGFKGIDILINNAGLALGLEPLYEGDIDDWEAMIDTNVKGLLYVTRSILPAMVARGKGHVVNIGSLAGVAAYPNGAVYCATKSAVKALSDGIREDVAKTAIRVTNIQPGLVETNFSLTRFHGDRERAKAPYEGIEPLTARDIADIVRYCLSAPDHVQICELTVTATHQANAFVVAKNAL